MQMKCALQAFHRKIPGINFPYCSLAKRNRKLIIQHFTFWQNGIEYIYYLGTF